MACPDMYESNSACGRFRLLALRFLMNSKLGAVRGVRAGPEVPAAEVGEVVALLPRPQPALVTEPEGQRVSAGQGLQGLEAAPGDEVDVGPDPGRVGLQQDVDEGGQEVVSGGLLGAAGLQHREHRLGAGHHRRQLVLRAPRPVQLQDVVDGGVDHVANLGLGLLEGAVEVAGGHPVEGPDLGLDLEVLLLVRGGERAEERLPAADHDVPAQALA